jgi:hypothetical protein
MVTRTISLLREGCGTPAHSSSWRMVAATAHVDQFSCLKLKSRDSVEILTRLFCKIARSLYTNREVILKGRVCTQTVLNVRQLALRICQVCHSALCLKTTVSNIRWNRKERIWCLPHKLEILLPPFPNPPAQEQWPAKLLLAISVNTTSWELCCRVTFEKIPAAGERSPLY